MKTKLPTFDITENIIENITSAEDVTRGYIYVPEFCVYLNIKSDICNTTNTRWNDGMQQDKYQKITIDEIYLSESEYYDDESELVGYVTFNEKKVLDEIYKYFD